MPQPNIPVHSHGVANTSNVVGIDGEPPILDDSQVWRLWAMKDIYLGQEGHRKYVPKVDDYILDTITQIQYKVIRIDPTTLVPELEEIARKTQTDEITANEGRFFSGGSLATPCARQIFYDDSVVRPTLTVPSQFHVQGSLPHHAIAYKGSINGNGGVPVSVRYDASFNPIGHTIPLEPILQRDPNIKTQWYLPPFYSTTELEQGEMLLILIYDDKGGLLSRTNWIVERSALLRDVSDADKFVSAISLESFFIDASDETNLLIPEQVLKNSVNLMGKVHYTDGTSVSYPVDGSKFELLYMDRAAESIASSKGVLVLKYYLADKEKAVNVINNNHRYFITRSFHYTITERDGAYSVKLYPVPVWVNDSVGWGLDWYMFTLDRNQWFNVTNDVYINQNSPTQSFNGKLYGPTQQLNVSIDLGSINGTFRQYVHPQQVDIRLLRPATDDTGDQYIVGFEAYQNPPYGEGLRALAKLNGVTNYTLDLSNSANTKEKWLDLVYYRTKPQYRTSKEPNAPAPNMFKLILKLDNGSDFEMELPVDSWNRPIVVNQAIKRVQTVKILFFTRYNSNDVFYSMGFMPLLVH